MDNKTDYRIYAKNLRTRLNVEEQSLILVEKIRMLKKYIEAKNVMLFYPLKYEINLLELLNDDKNFYLPKVFNKDLLVCPYTDELIKSKFNIMEPCSNSVDPKILDLIIVPALMADKNGYRLGYGGGFYDRFLSSCCVTTVSVVPKELLINNLPHDNFDVKIDFILST